MGGAASGGRAAVSRPFVGTGRARPSAFLCPVILFQRHSLVRLLDGVKLEKAGGCKPQWPPPPIAIDSLGHARAVAERTRRLHGVVASPESHWYTRAAWGADPPQKPRSQACGKLAEPAAATALSRHRRTLSLMVPW